jgi:hypothetical protein
VKEKWDTGMNMEIVKLNFAMHAMMIFRNLYVVLFYKAHFLHFISENLIKSSTIKLLCLKNNLIILTLWIE